jgi:hypothetical protein
MAAHLQYELHRIIQKMIALKMNVTTFMPEQGKLMVNVNGHVLTPEEVFMLDSENKITSWDINAYAGQRDLLPAIGDKVLHVASGKYGSVYAIDPGSASARGDQIIAVKFDDGSSVGSSLASEYKLITRKKDRTFGLPLPSGEDAWMA